MTPTANDEGVKGTKRGKEDAEGREGEGEGEPGSRLATTREGGRARGRCAGVWVITSHTLHTDGDEGARGSKLL